MHFPFLERCAKAFLFCSTFWWIIVDGAPQKNVVQDARRDSCGCEFLVVTGRAPKTAHRIRTLRYLRWTVFVSLDSNHCGLRVYRKLALLKLELRKSDGTKKKRDRILVKAYREDAYLFRRSLICRLQCGLKCTLIGNHRLRLPGRSLTDRLERWTFRLNVCVGKCWFIVSWWQVVELVEMKHEYGIELS